MEGFGVPVAGGVFHRRFVRGMHRYGHFHGGQNRLKT